MSKYVDIVSVEEMLENAQLISNGEHSGYCTEDIELSRLPIADVEPVKHGQWIEIGRSFFKTKWVCSECGNIEAFRVNDHKSYQYCHCGASMLLRCRR